MARILVADDEPSICSAFEALLATEGHTTLTAANGRDAVRLFREQRPDAVFLDIWLTIEGEASVSDAGYRFDGTNVYVNSDIEYLTPVTFFSGTIMSMKPVDAGQ